VLGVVGIDPRGAVANALSTPPGKYGRTNSEKKGEDIEVKRMIKVRRGNK